MKELLKEVVNKGFRFGVELETGKANVEEMEKLFLKLDKMDIEEKVFNYYSEETVREHFELDDEESIELSKEDYFDYLSKCNIPMITALLFEVKFDRPYFYTGGYCNHISERAHKFSTDSSLAEGAIEWQTKIYSVNNISDLELFEEEVAFLRSLFTKKEASRAGIHISLSLPDMKKEEAVNLYKNATCLYEIISMMAPLRRYGSRFSNSYNSVNDTISQISTEHTSWINLSHFISQNGRIEFRFLHSTYEFNTICQWIYCLSVLTESLSLQRTGGTQIKKLVREFYKKYFIKAEKEDRIKLFKGLLTQIFNGDEIAIGSFIYQTKVMEGNPFKAFFLEGDIEAFVDMGAKYKTSSEMAAMGQEYSNIKWRFARRLPKVVADCASRPILDYSIKTNYHLFKKEFKKLPLQLINFLKFNYGENFSDTGDYIINMAMYINRLEGITNSNDEGFNAMRAEMLREETIS